ncbi:threonine synthase [uncultured Eubacterium sp.]|uniref:threonine synthase n=1 Tax=uncultured Eubacterium sp. TaxID=165185 RepID=UPI0025ED9778|nr:threonine synthase [uncultured Eubacterium sp.]
MLYTSTRDNSIRVTASQAIAQGISEEGGLFVPCELPKFSLDKITSMTSLSYIERAKTVLRDFLTDFTEEELYYCVNGAYAAEKFSSSKIAPVVNVHGNENILELWHGPTCAFKDMALQLLPYLMTVSAKKTADGKTIVILVATSGDTGKAALEGFKNVENTKILVFYPVDGVSPMQKLQMTTQEGENVAVCAINGNFDDAQSAVKSIFTNDEIKAQLAEKNMMFSSANSINWGRLVPQIVYYFSAYCDLIEQGRIKAGDEINVVVPTGNFGNILAGYYAKKMGLPIKKLVCASNTNNVLTDFLKTGEYNRNRKFYATTSPSMDILISSNLERLLYHMSGEDSNTVNELMSALSKDGKYRVSPQLIEKIQEEFSAGYCDEKCVDETIKHNFDDYKYLCDTHTAVAVDVYENYVKETGDDIPTVIDSTASPYKFSKSVLTALLGGKTPSLSEFDMVDELNKVSDFDVPKPLKALKDKKVRFTDVCDKENMSEMVFKLLNL